ncbi:hypothetical protein DFH06DRAFT_1004040 [Mycena polygramma]|nr:hypothetical protein DFH06DRAFT_1004040 [Mycena polygramma]
MGPHALLFSMIPTHGLVRLMCTCRRVRDLIKETCFSVSTLLVPFFGDATEVQRFRLIQARTETLISGSVALQYLNRLRWPDSDLDIYVHRTCPAIPVDFIVRNGYKFDPRKSQDEDVYAQLAVSVTDRGPSYLGRGIADVLDFHKGNKKIQVIVSENTPMETIISFHTTCVMNIITHSNAYALYPRSTFVAKEALAADTVGAGQEAGRQKYIDRGWTMIQSPSLHAESELGVRMVRWVGDRFTWTLSLPPLASKPTDLCVTNSWQLSYSTGTSRMIWGLLDNPGLMYKYVVGDPGIASAVSDMLYVDFRSLEFEAAPSSRF